LAIATTALLRSLVIMAMPIPADVKQCVVFLYVPDSTGKPVPNGTGFFVAVPYPDDPNKGFVYLVTAGHVTRQNNTGPFYPEIHIRLKRHDGEPEFIRHPLVATGPSKTVFTPPDSKVDLALIPFAPDQARYEYKIVNEGLLPTAAELKNLPVQEGAEVFFAGLFLQHVSDRANIPIVRFGRVAFAMDEPVSWNGEVRDLLLVECGSFGGNSGSPVFYYLGADRNPGSLSLGAPVLKLAGVMMGAFQDIKPLQVVSTSQMAVSTSNLGIAAVVPVSKVRDLLFGPELSEHRRALVEAGRLTSR
jgi:hypothetical protein